MSTIHPTAIVSAEATLDEDVFVGPYAIVGAGCRLGRHCRIEAHAQLIKNVEIGPNTSIGQAAILGGDPQDIGFDPLTPSGVRIGADCVIREQVTIHRSTQRDGFTVLGDHNYLMATCHLGHDVHLGERNIIANAVLLAGHVEVGNSVFLGGGAVFHQFIRIGSGAVVQGNGSFSKDIPPYCTAQRTNRITGLNIVGLRRRGLKTEHRAELKRLFEHLFHSGKSLSQALATLETEYQCAESQELIDFMRAPSRKGVCRLRKRQSNED